jgi:hypothetical protein
VLNVPTVFACAVLDGLGYTIHFEPMEAAAAAAYADREQLIAAQAAEFARHLERRARDYPTNWFNFYDFWRGSRIVIHSRRSERQMKGLACSVFTMLPLALGAQAPRQVTPAEILQRVAAAVIPQVGFREVRTARLLKAPLVSGGRLRFANRAAGLSARPTPGRRTRSSSTACRSRSNVPAPRPSSHLIAGTPQFALVRHCAPSSAAR